MKRNIKKMQLGVGPKRNRRRWNILWYAVAIIAIALGVYLFLLMLAPVYIGPPKPNTDWNKPVPHSKELTEDRLYIPRLSLNLAYKSGDANVLNDALWHRFAERGDPEKGGNFILAGHRFDLGWNPGETVYKSPLYNIDKIQTGDYIYADFSGKRYQYEVTNKYEVKPTQVEIEAPSTTPKMTLYTCTLNGENDGREVVEAKLAIGQISPEDDLKVSK